MKRFLNISVFLLVFGLLVSSGCESGGAKEEEPKQAEKFFWASGQEPIGIAPIQTVPPSVTGVKEPVVVESELVAIDGVGSTVVSRTYPWVPKEVELNRTFDYFIKVTNLTDVKLTDILITEELSDNFDFTSASPAAREDLDKLAWEIQSLGPKASKLITVSGVANQTDPLEQSTNVITPIIPARAAIRVVQPRLELTKTAPAEALLCEPIPVVFVVANSGTGSARNVKIVVDGNSKLVFDVGTLTEGQSQQFSAELRATKTGSYIGKAVASSTTGLSAESAETTTVVDMPVLTITNDGPEQQYLGRPLTYEIIVVSRKE
jgi:hypothetical protein